MAEETYHLSINLPALEHALSLNIQRVSRFVATALAGPQSYLTDPLMGQGSVVAYQYSPAISWASDEAATEFRSWVLLNGFRDLAETVTHFLSSIQSLSTTALLQEVQAQAGHITPQQWRDLVVTRESQFEKANLPDKLRLLVQQCRLDMPSEVVDCIRSLYNVRNCLVHRSGIVQDVDLRGEPQLRASWLVLRPYVVTEDGAQPLVMPHRMEKAGYINIRRELTWRDFGLGQRIMISSEDFHDIAHGLFITGALVVKSLEQRMRSAGIPMSDPLAPSA